MPAWYYHKCAKRHVYAVLGVGWAGARMCAGPRRLTPLSGPALAEVGQPGGGGERAEEGQIRAGESEEKLSQ